MAILGSLAPETQPLRLLPAVDRTTGLLVYIPEPSYRHALARGGTLSLTLDLEPIATSPPAAAGGYSEPRTLAMWSDVFGVSPKTMSKWFKSGQVDAIRVGGLWRVALRDIPGSE